MTNEANALAKLNSGLRPGRRPAVRRLRGRVRRERVLPAVDAGEDPEPEAAQHGDGGEAGQYQGKQWGIPQDWGFDKT